MDQVDLLSTEMGLEEGLSFEEKVKAVYPEEYRLWGQDLKSREEIERSLQKKFRYETISRFTKAIKEYRMFDRGDKIAVAISGGKDSLLLAKLFHALQKFSDFDFELEFFCMDPGYLPMIYDSDIFAVSELSNSKPCYLCARMRRGFLYGRAQELGCNRLALGHHFNDVIETTLLNILWAGNYKIMMPKIVSSNFENMELIRPMYLVQEKDIIAWRDYAGLKALDCACTVTRSPESSQRKQIKDLIQRLKEDNPDVERSIFASGENVAVDAILGYSKQGKKHSFLEHYGDEEWIL